MDVDWVWQLFRKLPRHTQPDVSVSARDVSSREFKLRKINDHVYEVFNPVGSRPSVELVFFHGLQLEDSQEPHIDTWLCRNLSGLWLHWIPDEIPNARILTVSYDAFVNRTDEQGRSDMYVTTENLLQDLIGARPAGGEVGQDGCPVVFVGHCLGGIVMKQLCVYASSKLNLISKTSKQPMQNFLDNIKGFFFYASPHQGTRLADMETPSVKGPLFAGLTTLNTAAARQNEEFRIICHDRGWGTFAIGESHAITQGKFEGLFVEEGSARHNVDEFYTAFANHINVCRPESKSSSSFTKLLTFVGGVVKKAQRLVHKCEVPDYAVGLGNIAWDVQQKLVGGANLGIFGMGGIGKTTLAKKLFNSISKDFEYTCFLESVKDIKIMRKLKEILLRNFRFKGRKLDSPLTDFAELVGRKTLIVLDDIDEQEQLDILPQLQGGCLIITSRDRKFAESLKDCIVHDVDFLSENEAKTLFCFHAFHSKEIPDFLVKYVTEVVERCAGLPLTLEVVGRYLRCYTTKKVHVHIWKETLHKLTKAKSLDGKNSKVWASLKVSYDGLSDEEKIMFVDAATVFFQESKQIAFSVWSVSHGYPVTTWENLVNRSMVKFVTRYGYFEFDEVWAYDEEVWVHQQLRDMGKNIENFEDSRMLSGKTEREQLRDTGKKEKFEDSDTLSQRNENAKLVVDFLNANAVKAKIMKIQLFHSMGVALRLDSLLNLERLKYLDLNHVLCEGSLSCSLPNVSFLRCNGLVRRPKWFERLCCLESLFPERLSTFNINLSKMDNLALLLVKGCVVPKDFPEAVGNLTNLRILCLYCLEGLDHLPRNFGNLSSLRELRIRSLKSLKLPEELGKLVDLQYLCLSKIQSLELPKSLENLHSLVQLDLLKIDGLAGLSDSFGPHLQNLKVVQIIGCPLIKCLPDSFSELPALKRLHIADCIRFEVLGEEFGKLSSLVKLTLQDVAVKTLPANFGSLSSLEVLMVQSNSLKRVSDDFFQLPALEYLVISSSELERLPNGFPFLESLETLALVNCSKLEELPNELGRVSSLREVRLRNCERLRSLPERWGKPSSPQFDLLQGSESHEVQRQAGESSHTNATEEVRLLIYRCPSLDNSVLRSLGGVLVVDEGGSERQQLDDGNGLAPPFPRDETQTWNGYWTEVGHKCEMTVELCFTTNNGISGSGRDEVGQFTCTGELQGSQVHFVKQYTGLHNVQYEGEISNNTINGAWTMKEGCFSQGGEFHLQQQLKVSSQ